MKTSKILFAITILLFGVLPTANASSLLGGYDVIIDIGHGGVDPGTFKGNILEKDINLAIGKKLYEILQRESLNVGVTRLNDYALSDDSPFNHIKSRHSKDLKQRELIAESLGPKVFLSLHVNWSNSGRERGPYVIYQPTNQSYALAHLIQEQLNKVYGMSNPPVKGRSYFLIKNIELPSVIIEMGFLSSPHDTNFLLDPKKQEQISEAIAHAVKEYLLLYPTRNFKENK
ncbi:MAG TPA: N-acetylmuramoyl-L-alanine amidase [Bacillota bacterium]|nr:N-acetylmuramoyl-L-alanine amidase [Bacillota bacterium]